MKKIIYSQWDGSQFPFSLERKEIIDRFMENIIKGMSPNLSISQMFREGFPLAGMDFRVMGLEEMADRMVKTYSGGITLKNPLTGLWMKLDSSSPMNI